MKRKWIIFFTIIIVLITAAILIIPIFTQFHLPIVIKPKPKENNKEFLFVKQKAKELKQYCKSHQYSISFACILDMNLHSGKKRFFVYDFEKDTIACAGLVAHGSCNEYYLSKAKFSNEVGCGCSAFGRYKIGNSYLGRFGKAYKLYGLDTSNNNAFERNIVLHAYDCVPDEASYPQPIYNSLGCTMVSYSFLKKVSNYIDKTKNITFE